MKKYIVPHHIVFLFLFTLVFLFFMTSLVDSHSTMQIEVLPPKPISGQNFTVSVYDPTIVNDTPYLTDVKIKFQDKNYSITDQLPNRELTFKAPIVYTPTSISLKAYKENYNSTNKTITIIPDSTPSHVVITVINETLKSNEYFTLKVTDEFNKPIQNATVSIQNCQDDETDGFTNNTGYITLRAPNKQEITILAQKEGYQEDTIELWTEINKDSTSTLLSHPQTPVFIAVLILISTIIFVTLKNKKITFRPSLKSKKMLRGKKSSSSGKSSVDMKDINKNNLKRIQKSLKQSSNSKVEEILISKPKEQKETITLPSNKHENERRHQRNKNRRNPKSDSVEEKVDQLISTQSLKTEKNEWFEGTTSIRNTIDNKIKKRKKKSKST